MFESPYASFIDPGKDRLPEILFFFKFLKKNCHDIQYNSSGHTRRLSV